VLGVVKSEGERWKVTDRIIVTVRIISWKDAVRIILLCVWQTGKV
jgi:hypothetical protein